MCKLPALLLCAALGAMPASSEVVPSFEGTRLIGLDEKCLDVLGGAVVPGTQVVLFTCHGGENQQWAVPLRGFSGPIIGIDGQCLQPADSDEGAGDRLVVGRCDGSRDQLFRHRADGLLIDSLGRCVDVLGGEGSDRTPVGLFTCHGGANQRWREERAGRWMPVVGLFAPPRVQDFEFDFRDGRLYAAAEGRVYVSTDGGWSWASSPASMGSSRLARDPFETATIYAAGSAGLAVSRDGGRLWRQLDGQWAQTVFADWRAPGWLWTGFRTLRHSIDGGTTWTELRIVDEPLAELLIVDLQRLPSGELVVALAPQPAGGQRVRGTFISTSDGLDWDKTSDLGGRRMKADPHDGALYLAAASGLYHSADGRDWQLRLAAPEGVDDVAFDARSAGALVAAVRGQGLLRSEDAGQTWTPIAGVELVSERSSVTIGEAGRLLAAGAATATGDSRPVDLVISDDDGGTWRSTRLGFSATFVRDFAVDPADPRHLLAATDGGIFASTDRGITWREVLGLGPARLVFDAHRPGRVFAALSSTAEGAVWRSLDGGESWQDVSADLGDQVRGYALVTLPVDDLDAVLVSASGGPASPSPALFRSLDGGDTWTRLDFALAAARLVADPRTGTLFAGDFSAVWRSTDLGVTWHVVLAEDNAGGSGLAIDPSRAGRVVAAGISRLYESTDDGRTWRRLPNPGATYLTDLAVSPTGAMWLGDVYTPFRSLDDGRTWSPVTRGLPAQPALLQVNRVVPGEGREVYLATSNGGLFRGEHPAQLPLALDEGRFQVELRWRDFAARSGEGRATQLGTETGAFWFFSPDNLEVLVKVLDGSAVNGHFWVFIASLSNLQLDVTVTDDLLGGRIPFHNPLGSFASFASTGDFPAFTVGSTGAGLSTPGGIPEAAASTKGLLLDGRFEILVFWRDFFGRSGEAGVLALSDKVSGYWFFAPENLELAVKILDGRPVNGHFWVFVGALTNLEHTVVVRDRRTGAVRVYSKPLGELRSFADIEAFP